MQKRISFLLACLAGLLVVLTSGCGKSDSKEATASNGKSSLVYNLSEESETIDPQLVRGETGIDVTHACMEGLTGIGKKPGEIIPGVAKSWDTSEDGLTWTFHLNKNAKWSNGESITANDFAFGWKRALEPATGAGYAAFLYSVKNAEEYNTGKLKDFSKVGIEVVDDYTFKVTLATPCTYFTQLTAFPVTFPLNEKFYNTVKDQYALGADKMLYNGPWIIKSYLQGQGGSFDFVKNENYWNKANIKLDSITFNIIKDDNTVANLFTNEQVDVTRMLPDLVSRFKNNPQFKNDVRYVNDGGLWYFQFSTTNKYFKNVKIRKAFAMAVDRKVLCENIRNDGSMPAYAFVPYDTFGGKDTTFRKRYGDSYFKEDIAQAKQLLKEGLKEIGEKNVVAKLLINNNPQNVKVATFLQEELRKNLGVDITLEPTTFQNRLQKMRQKNYDLTYAGWGPDYNDPMTFLDLFTEWNPNNDTGWANKKYDALIEKAMNSPDNEVRMKAMAEAEKILMDELPIAPLMFTSRIFLVQNYVKDVVFGLGAHPSFYWAYIQK
jgi:oligopeptide transport system substrate-binding protein